MLRNTTLSLIFLILVVFTVLINCDCPNNCSGNGSCNGSCNCYTGYTGSDCSIREDIVNPGDSVSDSLEDYSWHYYRITVPQNSYELKFIMHQPNQDSDCDLYVRMGEEPSRFEYDQSDFTLDLDFEVSVENPTSGIYYAGVYGFRNCNYDLDFVLDYDDSSSCINNCSGRGSCNDGECSCNAGWAGNDCSKEITNITDGQIRHDSVGNKEWNYYSFESSVFVGGPAPTIKIEVNQTSPGDSDLYVAYERIPTLYDFDLRDATLQVNYFVSGANPQAGTYYIGVYGYSGCDYNIRSATEQSCPSQCSRHGVCSGSICQCDNGYSGTACEKMDVVMQLDTAYEGYAGDNSWNMYHINPDSSNNLQITVNQEEQGDCDLYIAANREPTRVDYDYRDITFDLDFDVVVESPQSQTWYIGIYGYRACPYHITAAIEKGACPNDCSGHGACTHDGRCDCESGWAGKDCGSPFYHLSNSILREDVVAVNNWVYYRYSIPETQSSFNLLVVEEDTIGNAWVYVKRGAPPELDDYDYNDVSIKTPFHSVYFRTEGDIEETNVYIGVYGNPFGEFSHPVTFKVIAYSPNL
eukprot:TRINITY_DN1476_c0_g1_i1.p1 TRINITY_DN1476_c0_g1~~TRINITY_DN1476_c0_g1_i1.p1  ORF type:complete len:581 (+),score=207.41 TRINITY_DN1476_c0_g1_i1:44-1786(+)